MCADTCFVSLVVVLKDDIHMEIRVGERRQITHRIHIEHATDTTQNDQA